MTILFSEDFETGTTTMEIVVDSGCSVEITNVNPINGAYSAKCYIFSQPAWTEAYLRKAIPNRSQIYAGVTARVDLYNTTGAAMIEGLLSFHGVGAVLCRIGIDGGRHLRIGYRDTGAYKEKISATILDLGVPHKIRGEISVGEAATIKVFLDDVEVADLTTTANNADAIAVTRVEIGARGGYRAEAVVYVDDLIVSDTPLPIVYHHLSINSTPITGIPFSINGTQQVTPYSAVLEEGTYIITMPSQAAVNTETYNFVKWEDGSTNPTRTINLTEDMTLTATYELAPTPKHILTVDSAPIRGIPFTIEKVS